VVTGAKVWVTRYFFELSLSCIKTSCAIATCVTKLGALKAAHAATIPLKALRPEFFGIRASCRRNLALVRDRVIMPFCAIKPNSENGTLALAAPRS
jgi:hypothetical protein